MPDIVVTWPKDRPLSSYLAVLTAALARGDEISYRVNRLPSSSPERCYRVHDGAVRGWTPILRCEARGAEEVRRVDGHGYWAAGYYVVCRPAWHPIDPIPMRGFQGWRHYKGGR
jgi:hypothetical protein